MKIKKIFSVFIVFVMVITIMPQSVSAHEEENNIEYKVSDASSDAVLAYYDVNTQTETLITADEIQDVVYNA